jgi:vitamin B12 transporter
MPFFSVVRRGRPGRFGFVPRQNLEVDFVVHTVWAKTNLDNFGGAFGDDPNNTQDYKSFFVTGQMRTLLFKNRWEQNLGIALADSNRHHENPEDPVHPFDREKGDFKGQLFRMDWQNNFFLAPTNTLSFGVDYEREQGKSEYYSWSAWGPSIGIFPRQQANSIGFYL